MLSSPGTLQELSEGAFTRLHPTPFIPVMSATTPLISNKVKMYQFGRQAECFIKKEETELSTEHIQYTKKAEKLKSGKWSSGEHARFLQAMRIFGNSWKHVYLYIGSRSIAQIRSHAQKYYGRMRSLEKKRIKNDPKMAQAVFAITREYHNQVCDSFKSWVYAKNEVDLINESIKKARKIDFNEIADFSLKIKAIQGISAPIPCYPPNVRKLEACRDPKERQHNNFLP